MTLADKTLPLTILFSEVNPNVAISIIISDRNRNNICEPGALVLDVFNLGPMAAIIRLWHNVYTSSLIFKSL